MDFFNEKRNSILSISAVNYLQINMVTCSIFKKLLLFSYYSHNTLTYLCLALELLYSDIILREIFL